MDDTGPTEDQLMNWNIHNDHADDAVPDDDHDDGPDTTKILDDIERAAAVIRAAMARNMHTDEQMKEQSQATRDLLDGWAYLRWAIEEENAPLPGPWAHAAQMAGLCDEAWGIIANAGWDDTEKTGGWQQAAVRWRDRFFALLGGDPHPDGVAILGGDLRPDPRVTANGGAAARAGWNLPSPDKTIGPCHVELMGRRVRVGVVSEVTLFGEPFLRIDFPQDSDSSFPEFYRPAAVYAITPDPPAREFPTAIASGPNPDWEDPF